MNNIKALQDEIKKQEIEKNEIREQRRLDNVKLSEKTAEFTVRMNELLNIKGKITFVHMI